MRTRNASGIANQSDHLPALYYFSLMHKSLAQVKVRCHHTTAVIDVHDVAGEEEIGDQRHDAAIGRLYWFPDRTTKVHTKVTGRELTVEHATRAELARDHRGARAYE